jgi:hypothetical protein
LDVLTDALSNDATAIEVASSMGRLLSDRSISNLLPWRYAAVIKGSWSADRARTFLEASRHLLFEGSREAPPVDEFNATMLPFYSELLGPDGTEPPSHCIPSLMLWLSEPHLRFFVRPDLYNQASRALVGGVAEE